MLQIIQNTIPLHLKKLKMLQQTKSPVEAETSTIKDLIIDGKLPPMTQEAQVLQPWVDHRGTVDQHNMDISFLTFTIVDEENAISYPEKADYKTEYKKIGDNKYQRVHPFHNSVFGDCVEILTVTINGDGATRTSVISENGGPYKTNTTFDGTPCCFYYVLENQ